MASEEKREAPRTVRDWDKIMASLSSPESSDAEDELNVLSVQKNAQKVADLLHHHILGQDPYRSANTVVPELPRGLKDLEALKQSMKETTEQVEKAMQNAANPSRE